MNKGLCCTCTHDKECAFARKFPVLQCEEFDDTEPKSAARKERKTGKK